MPTQADSETTLPGGCPGEWQGLLQIASSRASPSATLHASFRGSAGVPSAIARLGKGHPMTCGPLGSPWGGCEEKRVQGAGRPGKVSREQTLLEEPPPWVPSARTEPASLPPGARSPHPVLTGSCEASPWHGGVAPQSVLPIWRDCSSNQRPCVVRPSDSGP